MVDVPVNLIDYVWTEDRPDLINNPIYIHDLPFTGSLIHHFNMTKSCVSRF